MSSTEVPARWWAPRSAEPDARQAETAADKRRYVEAGLVPVECIECGNRVLVKKNSDEHTSVQWSAASTGCPEIAARVSAGAHSGQILGCSLLKKSIDSAVQRGRLVIGGD
jgi:DNA-directed RNA polymerase subunit RPC12/RpoP